jgi:protein disulfide-isomerase
MRPALLAWALAAVFSTSIAAPPGKEKGTVLSNDAVSGETGAEGGEAVDYTVFNGIKVPPMLELEGSKFAETIKDGYW